eukprot:gene10266-21423_t
MLITCTAKRNDFKETLPWCKEMRAKYNIQPGQSFGDLPVHLHRTYLDAECHRYFCKPHPKAGKGVFPCEPLNPDELINTLLPSE